MATTLSCCSSSISSLATLLKNNHEIYIGRPNYIINNHCVCCVCRATLCAMLCISCRHYAGGNSIMKEITSQQLAANVVTLVATPSRLL